MSEQRFQPVKGLKANIEKTSIEAGQLLIATDTGEMFLDVSNQERIAIGGSGVSVIYANDTEPQKITDLQYSLTRNGVDERVKVDDLLINIPDGAFYKVISVGTASLFCQRLAITGSGGGGGDTPTTPKINFVNNILSQLKNIYVYGEAFDLTIVPYAENDTTVTVTVSLYNEADTAVDAKAYYEYKKTVTNNYELVVDLGSYFKPGNTRIDIKLESLNSGSYLVRYGGQQIIELRLDEGGFHPEKIATDIEPLQFQCKPVGAVKKILHLLVDGFEVKTDTIQASESNNMRTASITGAMLNTHGTHTLDAYLTAEIEGKEIESNHLNYEVAYAATGNNSPIIWFMNKPTTIEQYEDIVVKYMVYDPVIGSSGTMIIEQLHDSLVVTTLDEVQYSASTPFTWVIADAEVGDNYYGISCKGVTESFVITVTPSERNMDYVQQDQMIMNLNASGRTNNESLLSRQSWSYNWNSITYDCELNNFNWHTNGWSVDTNGRSYLKVSDGASVKIPLSASGQVGISLNKDATQSYTFEFRLKIRNITSYDTLIKNITLYWNTEKNTYLTWDELVELADSKGVDPESLVEYDKVFNSPITQVQKNVSTSKGVCVSYLSETNNSMGFALGTQESYFGTGKEYVNAKYKEDEIFNISYVVSANNNAALSKVYIYINGLLTGISTISSITGRGFNITNKYITINSEYCDVDLYNVRVYQSALDSWSIVQNYLSDLRDREAYDQNQISNNVNNLTVIDYDKLLQYNQTQTQNGNPELLSMPYMVIQTVDNIGASGTYATDDGTPVNKKNAANVVGKPVDDENLPYQKGKVRYVKVSFTNPALDYAYTNGDLAKMATDSMPVENYYAYHCPSFVAYGGELNVQGTSSQAYPRRNYKLKLKNADYWRYAGGPRANTEERDITGKDGRVWCMDVESDSVHNNKFTLKIDYMESSGSYNTGFANMVHYMYKKHPLDYYRDSNPSLFDGIEDDVLKTYRTSVQGYPVLTFHAVKNSEGELEYQYIGRYNMNLDKGSDDSYGFKYNAKNPILKKDFKKIVECWEMADNQGNYCSFKFPYEGQTGFSIEEGGKYNTKGCIEIADHLEYRYNDDADNLDICYAFKENEISREELGSPLYENDIKPYEDEIANIRANNSELDAQLTTLEEQLAAETDKEKKKDIEAQIKSLEDANGITAQKEAIEKQSTAMATGDDYNSLILKRYKNIEKLYKWFNEVDIAANPYDDDEALLYGDILEEYEQQIEEAQSEIETIIYLFTDDESEEYKKLLAGSDSDALKAFEDEHGITTQREIIANLEQEIADKKAEGFANDPEVIAKYTFETPKQVAGTTYQYDTRAYRKAKFMNEFNDHLNEEYCLVYFIMTELLLCYDSRGKNMMIASWGPMKEGGEYIWFPIFYDIDTQLGINNTGIPTWDYDVDASINAAAGAETFSTANSVLWYNLLYCFPDKIKAKYQEMRLEQLEQDFIENAYRCSPEVFNTSYACKGVRPLVALNADFEYKYILPTLTVGAGTDYGYINTDGKWVQDTGNSFFYACQGDRDLSRQLLIRNRMNYLDSELQANIYAPTGATSTTSLKLRASANSTSTSDRWLDVDKLSTEQEASGFKIGKMGATPADCLPLDGTPYYQITPFLSQYVTMYYDDNNPTIPQKFTNDMPYVLPAVPDSIMAGYQKSVPFTQQLVYIPGANYLSKVQGLDMKYFDEIVLGSSIRLTELVLGSDEDGYYNNNNVSITLSDSADTAESPNENAKTLLKKIVMTGLQNIKADSANIDIGGSAKLEEFRALKTNITGATVAIGAPIHTMHLPQSITALTLDTNYGLDKIITDKLTNSISTSTDKQGLYIEGVTDAVDRSKTLTELTSTMPSSSLALSTISIKNDNLGYDSYQLTKTAMARKLKLSTPTSKPGLAIRLENVSWTPFEALDTAAEINSETTYYELNDHYQYVEIQISDSAFENKRANDLIFTKNAEEDETQITSMEMIDEFIKAKNNAGEGNPQFYDTTYNINVPYLSGELYVANNDGEAISELDIQEYNDLYPSLDIRVANVEKNYTIKYIQIDDTTGLTKTYFVQKAENCAGKADDEDHKYFSNPNRNVTLVPSKNNYDFFGWSKDGTKEGVVINPKTSNSSDYYDTTWEAINFEELAVDNVVTLYAVFELHKYVSTFYNYNGSLIGTTETPYSRTNSVNVIKTLPSKPADGLEKTSVWGFAGWALKTAPSRILDMSTVHPIMDYEFIACYEEKSVYDNVLDSSYLRVVTGITGGGCRIGLASGVNLSGKITLPDEINGLKVVEIADEGFYKQTGLTHVFFEKGTDNQIRRIGERAFSECENLEFYEMSSTTLSTVQTAGFRYTKLMETMTLPEQIQFFDKVTAIQTSAFIIPYMSKTTVTTINLSENLTVLGEGAFQNYTALTTVNIGSAGHPATLATVGYGPFKYSGSDGGTLTINYYYPVGNPPSETIKTTLTTNINTGCTVVPNYISG